MERGEGKAEEPEGSGVAQEIPARLRRVVHGASMGKMDLRT
jgi:hypothetical protein